ncbi:MAG TPA: MFS transporter [Acidobacteriaceae bacterium]|nr:MFS transporter [Acidobacteriaceae bacterium]
MGHTAQTDSSDLAPSSATPPQAEERTGSFAPLRIALFRDRWIAATISGVGTWMQDTAATWLMTVLTASPLLIALMQTAASLPVLALGLFAGSTADIYDRRRLLIFWQTWMLVSVGILAVLTFTGVVSPYTLLFFTFLLNIGSAMNNPAWQAIVPELVPMDQLPAAVTLNAASNNIARAVGPALGGLMVAAFLRADTGASWVFALNSASFVAVIWILWKWHRQPIFRSALPAERILGSVRSGLRYLRYAPDLQGPLIRAFVFTFFVSAIWALLALVAKNDLRQGAMGYGILNGCLGLGAVLAAMSLGWIRRYINADVLLAITSVYYITSLLVIALVRSPWAVIPALLGAGFCWTSTMSTLNVSVQLSVPQWVHARALGLYLMTFQGGLALGSVVWGEIAQRSSVRIALICSAGGLLVSLPFTLRIHILKGSLPDLTPYKPNRPLPKLRAIPEPDEGPVRISIDYCVSPENYDEFTHAIHELKGVRLRDGAVRWGVYRDAANPTHVNETFIMESWLDYLRSRERVTAADQAIREKVWSLHNGEGPPKISHGVWAEEIPGVPPSPGTFGAKSS